MQLRLRPAQVERPRLWLEVWGGEVESEVASLSPALPAVSFREMTSTMEVASRGGSSGQVASTSSPQILAPATQATPTMASHGEAVQGRWPRLPLLLSRRRRCRGEGARPISCGGRRNLQRELAAVSLSVINSRDLRSWYWARIQTRDPALVETVPNHRS